MDWLPVVSLIGLTIAVLVLGQAVVVSMRRTQESGRLSEQRTSSEGRLDARQDGSTKATEASSFSSMPTIGFPNARRAFREAFLKGDVESAIEVLPELERALGRTNASYLLSVSVLAAAGEQVDLQPLLDAINSDAISDGSTLEAIVTGAVQHYVTTDNEQEGLDKIKEALEQYVHDTSRPNEFRAHIANQLQMLYFGTDQTDSALKVATSAIELSPMEPSYHFNLSTIHEKRGNLKLAIEAIERCLEIGRNAPDDRDHIYQAWRLYRQNQDEPNMKAMKSRLETI